MRSTSSELGQTGEKVLFPQIRSYRDNDIMSTRGWVEGSWLGTKNTCINFERKDFTRWHKNHLNNLATHHSLHVAGHYNNHLITTISLLVNLAGFF